MRERRDIESVATRVTTNGRNLITEQIAKGTELHKLVVTKIKSV